MSALALKLERTVTSNLPYHFQQLGGSFSMAFKAFAISRIIVKIVYKLFRQYQAGGKLC